MEGLNGKNRRKKAVDHEKESAVHSASGKRKL